MLLPFFIYKKCCFVFEKHFTLLNRFNRRYPENLNQTGSKIQIALGKNAIETYKIQLKNNLNNMISLM